MEAPAQTTGYLIAGYIVIFGTMLVYLVSLIIRSRNLQQDFEILRSAEDKEK